MCGITGYIGNKNAIKTVIDGITILEYRGYDSSGIAYINKNKLIIKKEKGRIKNLVDKLDLNQESNLAIAHTRWATHGVPSKINAHPHKVGKITIVHNGIIENYQELKEELVKNNYKLKSETDTEIAAGYIDYIYNKEKNILKALSKITQMFKGAYALGIILEDNLNTLYAVRNTSPLIIALGENENYISSDVPAILKYTNKYMLLDDNEIAEIQKDKVNIYNQELKSIKKKIIEYDKKSEIISKNGYDHFMLKEIHEEPEVFKRTINKYKDIDLEKIINLKKYNKIHIVSCGSAYYAGKIGQYLLEKYANIETICEVASEYRYKNTFYNSKTLVILVSQSGETADTLACLMKAKKDKIDTLAIVNVYNSSIAREAKYVIYTESGCEIAVATTKAYLSQLAIFSLIVSKITDQKIDSKNINEISKKIELLINNDYNKIAKDIYKEQEIFFIGRQNDYALCLEGSLKLKEISYINSIAYPSGELKHGTISLIKENTIVIAIVTNDDIKEKTISNIKEIKSRGAKVILITNQDIQDHIYDYKIDIPKISDLYQAILTVIPLQIIAYNVAKLKGCDIDKPKNLAKSVTVE